MIRLDDNIINFIQGFFFALLIVVIVVTCTGCAHNDSFRICAEHNGVSLETKSYIYCKDRTKYDKKEGYYVEPEE